MAVEKLFPLAVWPMGIEQARLPANDNALRMEAYGAGAIGIESDPPPSPAEGNCYIIGPSPTWSDGAENDVALYRGGAWRYYEPFYGWPKWVDGELMVFDGGWVSAIPE